VISVKTERYAIQSVSFKIFSIERVEAKPTDGAVIGIFPEPNAVESAKSIIDECTSTMWNESVEDSHAPFGDPDSGNFTACTNNN